MLSATNKYSPFSFLVTNVVGTQFSGSLGVSSGKRRHLEPAAGLKRIDFLDGVRSLFFFAFFLLFFFRVVGSSLVVVALVTVFLAGVAAAWTFLVVQCK